MNGSENRKDSIKIGLEIWNLNKLLLVRYIVKKIKLFAINGAIRNHIKSSFR
jgi:hypothetical protein